MKSHPLIERYVYDVTRRIDSKSREEIEKELTSNIYDMLGDNPTDVEIREVLLSLGKPSDLADKYRANENNYLISPKYYHDYINTLKIAGIIVLSFTLVINIFTLAFSINTLGLETAVDRFADGIGESLLGALFYVFSIVTFIFFVLERYKINLNKNAKPFSLDELPEVPKHEKLKVHRFGRLVAIIFSTTFTVLFVMLLFNHHKFLGWYYLENDVLVFSQAFNDGIKYFIFPVIVSFGIDLSNDIYKMTKGTVTKLSSIITMVNQLFQVLILQLILTTKSIIHPNFFNELSMILNKDLTTIMSGYDTAIIVIHSTMVFVALIIIGTQLMEFFQVRKLLKGK